jgi:hypothetical protein
MKRNYLAKSFCRCLVTCIKLLNYSEGVNITVPSQTVNETEVEKLKKLKYNLDWLYKNYKYFEKYHKNQFVAIKDKSFLDKDIELEKLVKRLEIKNFDDSIAIEFIY